MSCAVNCANTNGAAPGLRVSHRIAAGLGPYTTRAAVPKLGGSIGAVHLDPGHKVRSFATLGRPGDRMTRTALTIEVNTPQ